jgi:hypothetical protein
MRKPKPKNVKLTPPPEAQERLAGEDRSALREAVLELQVAGQAVQLLVHEHRQAVARAQSAERRLREVEARITERHKLGKADKVDASTGAITRAPAAPET